MATKKNRPSTLVSTLDNLTTLSGEVVQVSHLHLPEDAKTEILDIIGKVPVAVTVNDKEHHEAYIKWMVLPDSYTQSEEFKDHAAFFIENLETLCEWAITRKTASQFGAHQAQLKKMLANFRQCKIYLNWIEKGEFQVSAHRSPNDNGVLEPIPAAAAIWAGNYHNWAAEAAGRAAPEIARLMAAVENEIVKKGKGAPRGIMSEFVLSVAKIYSDFLRANPKTYEEGPFCSIVRILIDCIGLGVEDVDISGAVRSAVEQVAVPSREEQKNKQHLTQEAIDRSETLNKLCQKIGEISEEHDALFKKLYRPETTPSEKRQIRKEIDQLRKTENKLFEQMKS